MEMGLMLNVMMGYLGLVFGFVEDVEAVIVVDVGCSFVVMEKPTKKPAARRQSAGVQIRDTPGVSVSKKKAPAKAERSKGETDIPQACGSSEGAVQNQSFLMSQKGYSDENDDDHQQSNDEQTESDNLRSSDDEEEIQEDEFVHTPKNYVPTNNESNDVDDEEYVRINEEMYSDVNVELKDTELEGERKDDEEMTDAGHVDAEQENVNQEVAGDQVKDDAQATVIAAHATQKTEVPLPSSFISSDYATKFLNFDNIPSADTEIISMMEIKVQHEDPSI
nr:hypothetical protein [Tanacetum cinerariifolium]